MPSAVIARPLGRGNLNNRIFALSLFVVPRRLCDVGTSWTTDPAMVVRIFIFCRPERLRDADSSGSDPPFGV